MRHEIRLNVTEEPGESARRIRDLEAVRIELARTLLDVQQACVTAKDPHHAQRLLSAAVHDLEELDARLFEARTVHASINEGLLAG